MNKISLEIADYSNIQNLQYKDEKTKFIVKGTNCCKIYDKIKDLSFYMDKTLKLIATFNCDCINTHKFTKFILSVKDYINNKTYKKNWKQCTQSQNLIKTLSELKLYEKEIKNKSYNVYNNNSLFIDNNYVCSYDSNNNFIVITKKKIY